LPKLKETTTSSELINKAARKRRPMFERMLIPPPAERTLLAVRNRKKKGVDGAEVTMEEVKGRRGGLSGNGVHRWKFTLSVVQEKTIERGS